MNQPATTQPDASHFNSQIAGKAVLCAILAGVVVAQVVAIASYAYYRVTTAMEPENLADRVEVAIQENYPQMREQMLAQVKQDAPEIAAEVSQELIGAAPAGRKELEELTQRQIALGLDHATEFSAEQFRQVLRDNREEFVQVFEAIEDAPEDVRELVLNTEEDLEESLGVDLQKQARSALQVHRQLNDKLEHLASPDVQLSPRELLERRIVRILRTIQLRESDMADKLAREPRIRGLKLPKP
jgi:hypothetical protein